MGVRLLACKITSLINNQLLNYHKTRKSSCVTARGVPPAAYPVRGWCVLLGRRGYPLFWSWSWSGGRGYPELGYPLPLARTRTGYPFRQDQDRGTPSGQDQDRGLLPLERTWDQGLQKGPGTRDWDIPPPPPRPWTDRRLWKHYLPVVLLVRAVTRTFAQILLAPPITDQADSKQASNNPILFATKAF